LLFLPLRRLAAEVALSSGDLDRAQQEAELLLAQASSSGEATWCALAHRTLGRIAAHARRWDAAEHELEQAGEIAEREGAPFAAWPVMAAMAELVAERRGARAAEPWIARASSALQELTASWHGPPEELTRFRERAAGLLQARPARHARRGGATPNVDC